MSVSEQKKNIYDDLIAAGAPNTYGEAIKELVTTYNNSKFSYDPVTDKAFQAQGRRRTPRERQHQ